MFENAISQKQASSPSVLNTLPLPRELNLKIFNIILSTDFPSAINLRNTCKDMRQTCESAIHIGGKNGISEHYNFIKRLLNATQQRNVDSSLYDLLDIQQLIDHTIDSQEVVPDKNKIATIRQEMAASKFSFIRAYESKLGLDFNPITVQADLNTTVKNWMLMQGLDSKVLYQIRALEPG